ncbi:MAG: hypothetical protein DI536_20060 [Archangium gephyra]|uniref:Ig-like domain-containing protein n=1 Tax=Archangium gephyra TaxID=48 RepID=A0A2W5UNC6_9BACT|nr:MAG: hypothetical protein DI536_20060 [Archangium gephyra]
MSGYANDFTSNTNGCKGSQGLDRMVRFQVPAGHRVTATVTPTVSTFDPMLSLVRGAAAACVGSSATCVASADTGADNAAETASWFNGTGAPVDMFAVVDDYDAQSFNGAYTLSISASPPPAGDTCETALAGSSGVAISRTVTDFTNDYASSTSCASPSTGADLVIVYAVPANQSLTVTATPSASVDVSINLSLGSGACGARTCVAGVSKGANGVTESLGWNNVTGAAQNVYVTIDSTSSSTGTVSVTGTVGASLACGPLTCGSGCCSGGVCQTGTSASACGTNGAACNTCTSPAQCSASQACSATNLPTGAPCTATSQCYEPVLGSAVCETSWPGGYCSSICFLTNQLCGGFGSSATGWCTANNQCLQLCNAPGSGQSNCRANYVCDTAAGTPSQGVCVPRCPTVACASGRTCNAQGYCI